MVTAENQLSSLHLSYTDKNILRRNSVSHDKDTGRTNPVALEKDTCRRITRTKF